MFVRARLFNEENYYEGAGGHFHIFERSFNTKCRSKSRFGEEIVMGAVSNHKTALRLRQ